MEGEDKLSHCRGTGCGVDGEKNTGRFCWGSMCPRL